MSVLRLVEYQNRGLVKSLKELLAQAEAGEAIAAAVIVKYGPNDHRAFVMGDYKRHPEQALSAIFQLETRLKSGYAPLEGFQ